MHHRAGSLTYGHTGASSDTSNDRNVGSDSQDDTPLVSVTVMVVMIFVLLIFTLFPPFLLLSPMLRKIVLMLIIIVVLLVKL